MEPVSKECFQKLEKKLDGMDQKLDKALIEHEHRLTKIEASQKSCVWLVGVIIALAGVIVGILPFVK